MRELKFRVWTGLEMEYDVTVGKFGTFYVNPGIKGDGLDEDDSACLTQFNTKYDAALPVMQYTGLKDKTGKEIYEDDIIRIASGIWYKVVFEDGCFIGRDCGNESSILKLSQSSIMNFGAFIFGNIHENAELL